VEASEVEIAEAAEASVEIAEAAEASAEASVEEAEIAEAAEASVEAEIAEASEAAEVVPEEEPEAVPVSVLRPRSSSNHIRDLRESIFSEVPTTPSVPRT
jgi:hypothetical protein